ncbi:MAG: alpha/beta hydrolase [Haliangiales bacterium]
MRAAATLLLIAVAACARPSAPAQPLAQTPAAPAGMVHTAGTFTSGGDATLFEQCWRPADRPPRSALVIVHGIKDHSARYARLAARLVGAGHAVCGFDHRGHGRSAGPRFDIRSFDAVVDDIDRYLGVVRGRFPGAPVFMFGHSMGGVLVPLHAIERGPDIAGIIVSAPALHPDIHPFEIASLLLVARAAPGAPLLDAPDDTFSPDPAVIEAMRADPLIARGRGTGQMAAELARGIERVWAGVATIRAPILILSGTDDRAVDPRGSVELRRRVGSPDADLRLYRGAGHDLAHDPMRDDFERDIAGWLDAHAPG